MHGVSEIKAKTDGDMHCHDDKRRVVIPGRNLFDWTRSVSSED